MTTITHHWPVSNQPLVNALHDIDSTILASRSRVYQQSDQRNHSPSSRGSGHNHNQGQVDMNEHHHNDIDPELENDEDPSDEDISSDGISDDDDEPCIYFNDSRHLEPIRGEVVNLPPWRLKDKVRL